LKFCVRCGRPFQRACSSPSQFATWLRMRAIDICAEGFKVGALWIGCTGRKDTGALVRYVSAVMRNQKHGRALDWQF